MGLNGLATLIGINRVRLIDSECFLHRAGPILDSRTTNAAGKVNRKTADLSIKEGMPVRTANGREPNNVFLLRGSP